MTAPLKAAIERESTDRITDIHLWRIGHGIYAAEIALVIDTPQTPGYYKALIPEQLPIVHATIEVHPCREH